MKRILALFVFLVVAACVPTPTISALPAPTQGPTAVPTLTDGQFFELTGTVRINAIAEYAAGVLPYPADVTLSGNKGIAVALIFEGSELPVDISNFLTATLIDSAGHVYPASFAIEMGCWPRNMATTDDAWQHVSQSRLCGEGAPGESVAGFNGVVIAFTIDDTFAQAVQVNFSLEEPGRTYFTTLP